MGRTRSRIALALPFAWIGFVGSWLLTQLLHLSRGDATPLLLTTPVVAAGLGWLIASLPRNGFVRGIAFLFGTLTAGGINGLIVGTVTAVWAYSAQCNTFDLDCVPRPPQIDVIGFVLAGGACSLFYLPPLLAVLLAHLRARRGRPCTGVHASDHRAITVVAAGTGALALWLGSVHPSPSLASRWILVSPFIIGLFALFADGLAYARIRAQARAVQGLVPVDGNVVATSAECSIDFGLGHEVSQVVVPATDAYRDTPRRAVLVYGRPRRAARALLLALALDATVAAAGVLFVVRS
jgi:hypothetical protein